MWQGQPTGNEERGDGGGSERELFDCIECDFENQIDPGSERPQHACRACGCLHQRASTLRPPATTALKTDSETRGPALAEVFLMSANLDNL